MKHYTYDEHYGRLESYRGSSDKLFLTERLTHSDAMDAHLSLTIAKHQLDDRKSNLKISKYLVFV